MVVTKPITSTASAAACVSVTQEQVLGAVAAAGRLGLQQRRRERQRGGRQPAEHDEPSFEPRSTRPVGKATSMWTSAPTHRFSSRRPIVNAQAAFA